MAKLLDINFLIVSNIKNGIKVFKRWQDLMIRIFEGQILILSMNITLE